MKALRGILCMVGDKPRVTWLDAAALLLRSLEPDDGDELTGEGWKMVWAAEIDRRMREVAEGKVELVDGDQVDAEVRAMLDAPMP
jgi:hypothetical protein